MRVSAASLRRNRRTGPTCPAAPRRLNSLLMRGSMPVLTWGLQSTHARMEESAMAEESRWRDDDRYRLADEERLRWDSWRSDGEHGRMRGDRFGYGREFGGSYPLYRTESAYGGYQGGYGRDDWRDDYPRGRYPSLGYGRDYGAPYRGYGLNEHDRGWGRGRMGD